MPEHNINARLETFCDGVIAIAITLLILEIKVPPAGSVHSIAELSHALKEQWTSWFAFMLSFGSILIAWINHHAFFKYINKTSNTFIYANGFILLTIVVLPYPTALVAEYLTTDYAQPAVLTYCVVTLLGSAAWIVLFQSALTPKCLSRNEKAREKLLSGRRQCAIGFIFYSIICITAIWLPVVAMCCIFVSWLAWLVIGIFFGDLEFEEGVPQG